MQALSLDRSNVALSAVVSVATVAALALLGLVLAYWTWTWLAPHSQPRAQALQTDAGAAATARAASGFFGSPKRERNGAAPMGSAVSLLGVVAASGNRSGYAVLRLDAKQTVAVHEGRDIEPGVRLAEVHVRSVVLERNGVRETLALQERNAQAAGGMPRK
jgi:general secretion pathway protein C